MANDNIGRRFVNQSETNASKRLVTPEGVSAPSQDGIGELYHNASHARYPDALGKKPYEKWILFEVKAGRHILRNTIAPEAQTGDGTLASVALYLPDGALKSGIDVDWATSDLGGVTGAMLEQAIQTMTHVSPVINQVADGQVPALKDLKNIGLSTIDSVLKRTKGAVLGRIMEGVGNAVDAISGGEANDAARIAIGGRVNPRTDTLFQNVNYRQHTLNFRLTPRNRKEADAIDTIVSMFQFYMLPSYGSPTDESAFMVGFPYEFEIRMFSEYDDLNNHHVNTIGRSVLTNCTIDNTADGKVAFIEDLNGHGLYPVVTNMTLTFQEIRLLGRDSAEIVRGGAKAFKDPRFSKVK